MPFTPSRIITPTNMTTMWIDGVALPLGSARGITQTLQPIENGELLRDINGTLVDLTIPAQRKFKSTISCTDVSSPTLAALWKGTTLAIVPATTLMETTTSLTFTLQRNPYSSDTVWAYAPDGTVLTIASITMGTGGAGATITFSAFPDGESVAIVEYQPLLQMMVASPWRDEFQEWAGKRGWSLDLEEV